MTPELVYPVNASNTERVAVIATAMVRPVLSSCATPLLVASDYQAQRAREGGHSNTTIREQRTDPRPDLTRRALKLTELRSQRSIAKGEVH